MNSEFEPSLLHELFTYDESTGELCWKNPTGNRVKNGDLCGCQDGHGYLSVRIFKKLYFVHRVAWAYVHGKWPEGHIDHINGDPLDNRMQNLRNCTRSQNLCNQKLSSRNKSGIKGVSWWSHGKAWRGKVTARGEVHHAGYFNSISAAANAVHDLRKSLHGAYTRHQ